MNNEELSLKLDFILLPEKFGPLPQPRAGINEFASHIIVVVPYITPFTLKVHTHTHTQKKKLPQGTFSASNPGYIFFIFLKITVISEEFSVHPRTNQAIYTV